MRWEHLKEQSVKVVVKRIALDEVRQLEEGAEAPGVLPQVGKRFRVALSFPGERRTFVQEVANYLGESLGRETVFYDKHFESELARPALDPYLQNIYRNESDLVAVFLEAEYEQKEWCGLEWRAIRDLITTRQRSDIMAFRFDNTPIDGLYTGDGYVDIAGRPAKEMADLILQRLGIVNDAKPAPLTSVELPSVDIWFSPQWPVTDPDIFGREEELALLDAAWDENKLNIVAMVAAGGVGKTALVNRWVNYHMRPGDWRGAERVFAWSFYSQGAGEGRQSSADRFIDRALRWFGDKETGDSATAAYDKGQRLAELVREQRTLLLLDGAEHLQEPHSVAAEYPGQLKDPGLKGLLRGLANGNPGLCVVSTRIAVADLKPYLSEGGTALSKDLDDLTPESGAAYLKSLRVEGSQLELLTASEEFGNHALALTLLGHYLVKYRDGDAIQRDTIPDLFQDKERGGHAMRVMAWYAKTFANTPEGEMLHVLGLFDRPAELGSIDALRSGKVIVGLTDTLHTLSPQDWTDVLENLRGLRLVADGPPVEDASHAVTSKDGETLDCHPLVREYFGERLEKDQPEAWRAAHNRLYEYYSNLPEKDLPDSIEEMAPLFQAVIHGCHAGRHQEAMNDVYHRRIQRGHDAYSTRKLGAFSADLSALSGFFDPPWHNPVRELAESDQAFVLNEAATALRALGRLDEAVAPVKAGLEKRIAQKDLTGASISAANLSELLLTLGRVNDAQDYAEKSVGYADAGSEVFWRVEQRTTLADTLHQAGRLAEAEDAFDNAEAMQKEDEKHSHPLFWLRGFRFCDLILAHGDANKAKHRARQTLELAVGSSWLLHIALDRLTLGRAELLLIVAGEGGDFTKAETDLDAAVDGLRKAGQQDFLPRGLLARTELYRLQGHFAHVRQDLDEVWEIGSRGGMRLFMCDTHLECARTLTAMASAGVTLDVNALAPDSPFVQFLEKDGDWKENALRAARGHIAKAAEMIKETGYHRRDPEIPLETARIEAIAGNTELGKKYLETAKQLIDKMGTHCWDRDTTEIGKMLDA